MKNKKFQNIALPLSLTAGLLIISASADAITVSAEETAALPEENSTEEAAGEISLTEDSSEAAGQAETKTPKVLKTGGMMFDPVTLADTKNMLVTMASADEDLSDGYTWTMHMINKTDRDLTFQFVDPALNKTMCQTGSWGSDSFSVKAGLETEGDITWTADDLAVSRITDIDCADFTLQVFESSQDVPYLLNQDYTFLTGDEGTAEAAGTENGKLPEAAEVVKDDPAAAFEILSYDKDETGQPLWTVYMENRSSRKLEYELDNVFIDGDSADPSWFQIVYPGMKAYSKISFFNVDNAADPPEGKQIDFDLSIYKEDPSQPGTYTDPEVISRTVYPPDPEAAGEGLTEAAADLMQADPGDMEEQSEAVTEAQSETAAQAASSYRITVDGVEDALDSGYYGIDLTLENTSDAQETFEADRVVLNDIPFKAQEEQTIPAGGRRDMEILMDADALRSSGIQSVENAVVHIITSDRFGKIIGDDALTVYQQEGGSEDRPETLPETLPESEAETKQTESVAEDVSETASEIPAEDVSETASEIPTEKEQETFDDEKTVKSVQARLKYMGYEIGDTDGLLGSKTKAAIADYRRIKGLPQTDTIDEQLLWSMNTADSESYKKIQEELLALGYDIGQADGLTGPASRDALNDFKSKNGFDDEGLTEEILQALEKAAQEAGKE